MTVSLARGGSGSFGRGREKVEIYFTFQGAVATKADTQIISRVLCEMLKKTEADLQDITMNVLLGGESIVLHAGSHKRAKEIASSANAFIAHQGVRTRQPDHMVFGVR